MKLKTKLLLSVGFITVLSGLIFIGYTQYEISKRQEAIEKGIVGQKELADNIMRSQNQYATKKDIENFAKEQNLNVGAIKKDLSKLGAELTSVNSVKAKSTGVNLTNVKTTSVGEKNPVPPPKVLECKDGKCENPDKFGYLTEEQKLQLDEQFNELRVPLGSVGFSAWKQNPWTLKLDSREYGVTTVVGLDAERRQYFYNQFTVTVDGKKYNIPIVSAKTLQKYPEAEFQWWNPSLNLGFSGGTYLTKLSGEFITNVGVNVLSYGKYTQNPEFKFLSVGLGYGFNSDRFHVTISPLYYNIGSNLPLINNSYVGPVISVDLNGNTTLMLGLSVGL